MDDAIFVVRNHINNRLSETRKCLSESEFAFRSYSRWAAYEIMSRMAERTTRLPEFITGIPHDSPIDIIEEFLGEMDLYLDTSKTNQSRRIFTIAKNTGEDILTLFS